MAHPNGWRIVVDPSPETSAECCICPAILPMYEPRIQTYVDDIRVTEVCMECGDAIVALKKRIPATGKLRVEAVA